MTHEACVTKCLFEDTHKKYDQKQKVSRRLALDPWPSGKNGPQWMRSTHDIGQPSTCQKKIVVKTTKGAPPGVLLVCLVGVLLVGVLLVGVLLVGVLLVGVSSWSWRPSIQAVSGRQRKSNQTNQRCLLQKPHSPTASLQHILPLSSTCRHFFVDSPLLMHNA